MSYDQQHHLEIAWQEILTALMGQVDVTGYHPDNGVETLPGVLPEGLRDTPRRAASALLEMTTGYQVDVPALFTTFEGEGYDEMIVLRDIQFSSLCEHHVLPFVGAAHIAYVPGDRIVGLSKLARLVDAYARRLQVQERLTMQIADAMETHLEPKGVAVVVEASHTCMALRGIRKANATMVTSALRGVLWKPEARSEAMSLLGVS